MCTHHTVHTKIPSCHSKKRRHLWSVMMEDSAPTHERKKHIKTFLKICSLKNRLWLLKYAGRPTSKKNKQTKKKIEKKKGQIRRK